MSDLAITFGFKDRSVMLPVITKVFPLIIAAKESSLSARVAVDDDGPAEPVEQTLATDEDTSVILLVSSSFTDLRLVFVFAFRVEDSGTVPFARMCVFA
jgi:hypothetical protein